MADTLRLFFALAPPAPLREALGRWQRDQPGLEGASRPDGLHVTLAFLGPRPASGLPALEALGARVAARHRAFPLATGGLGGFPEGARARVLWLGLAPSPALEALAADLREALAAAGEPFDPKPFRAHLTLARLRRARSLADFPAPRPATFEAEALRLYESRPGGQYLPVRVWNLGSSTAGV
ncbi:MAG TPA: RNA 2',3'-cyclic phosphodiesterase [Holophagaceae bacterium]